MVMSRLLLLASSVAYAHAVELTPENWDAETSGKTVFLKFMAPWCGHSKQMKPAWDSLMKQYEGSNEALVGDIDCTAGGKVLCEKFGIQGFPHIKWGDPNMLEDYEGSRELDGMVTWSKEHLKAICGPAHIHLCDASTTAEIERLQKLSDEDLDREIKQKDGDVAQAEVFFDDEVNKLPQEYQKLDKERTEKKSKESEAAFDAHVKKLQEKFDQLEKDRDAKQAAVKASGQILMKMIKAYRGTGKKAGKQEL